MIMVTTARTREAIGLMSDFLPPTAAKRHTTKGAHWIYMCDEADAEPWITPDVEARVFRTMAETWAWIARDSGEAVQ